MENKKTHTKSNDLNTKDYWDYRFNNNWEARTGKEQTRFFSDLACAMLPEWFIHDVQENEYNLCDIGCALGDALDSFQELFRGSKLYGEDFSPAAIEKSKLNHPEYFFEVADILDLSHKKQYDIIYCSNVLEHFLNPREVLARIIDRSVHYTIVMIPFREKAKFHEHVSIFDLDAIPLFQSGALLVYAQSAVCRSPYYNYNGEQLLLIYAKNPQAQQSASLKDVAAQIMSIEFSTQE